MARILVVDDDRELRDNIVEVLAGAGFEVAAAGGGEEALELAEECPYDLVLLDLIMPGMDGMKTLRRLKDRCPRAKMIMITAFATVDNAVEAMRQGAEDYISKPFKVNELLVTVRRCLEQARIEDCRLLLDMDSAFSCLSNSIRRKILFFVATEERVRFMDIPRHLEIEDHTKVNFHLKVLKEANLIEQDQRKFYVLTKEGKRLTSCVQSLVKNLTT